MRHLRALLASCALCLCPALYAQYNVGTVHFSGDTRYAEQQLVTATGLKPGDAVGSKELGAAAQRLMDTGAFDDIDTKLEGPMKAIHIVFKVKPVPDEQLLPVVLENFVWYTPEQLHRELQGRVPLFRDRLPESGNLTSATVAALTALLAEKQVSAKVVASVEQGNAVTPYPFLSFRVMSPSVVLDAVRLAGVTSEMQASVTATVKQVVGQRYHEGDAASADRRILEDYLDAGYRDAKLRNLERTPAIDGGVARVTLTGTVEAGERFTLKSVSWEPTAIFSADDFARASKLRSGDPYSDKKVQALQSAILSAYHNAGYADAILDGHPQTDVAAHTIALSYTVTPGEQYRMGETEVVGLTEAQQQQFQSAWRLKPGAPFDESYVRGFLKNNTALQTLNGYAATYKIITDPQTHKVKVVMTFVSMGRG